MTIRWMLQNRYYRGWCSHSPMLKNAKPSLAKPSRSGVVLDFKSRRGAEKARPEAEVMARVKD